MNTFPLLFLKNRDKQTKHSMSLYRLFAFCFKLPTVSAGVRRQIAGIMILLSSQKSSVIKPSQLKRTARSEPRGGEIPMTRLTDLGLLLALIRGIVRVLISDIFKLIMRKNKKPGNNQNIYFTYVTDWHCPA